MTSNLLLRNIVVSTDHFVLIAVIVHIGNFEKRYATYTSLFLIREAHT